MSPYEDRPSRSFWRTGVVEQALGTNPDLYVRKFDIKPTDAIATAGSCLAQNIARTLKAKGHRVIDAEPAPPGLSGEEARAFGYELYSARYGNIYVARQLLQLLKESDFVIGYVTVDGFRHVSFSLPQPVLRPSKINCNLVIISHTLPH